MKKRVFNLWIGKQGSGKTYRSFHEIDFYANRKTIISNFVYDVTNEYQNGRYESHNEAVCFYDAAHLVRYLHSNEMPRTCIFDIPRNLKMAVKKTGEIMRIAIRCGHIMHHCTELSIICPSGNAWRGPEELYDMTVAGRHLPNIEGEVCPQHLNLQVQYPNQIHTQMRMQAYNIYAWGLEGKEAERWVTDNFGKEAWEYNQRMDAANEKNGTYHFQVLKGKKPPKH